MNNWFLMALLATMLWGGADLFYKRGSKEEDKYSHLKIVGVVGIVMGIQAAITMILHLAQGNTMDFTPMMMVEYLPVSMMYILSMALGYFGLKFLELSISSPVQNTSGAVCFVLLAIFSWSELRDMDGSMLALSFAAVLLIMIGMVALAVIERWMDRRVRIQVDDADQKYHVGVLAILFPILYAVIDALGTTLDGLYLDTWELLSADNANYAYMFTFCIVGVICLIYVCGIKKQSFRLFDERDKGIAAVLESAGQYFYANAMAGNAVFAAPMIASYSIVSLLLSRVFLKEKLRLPQYLAIAAVMIGIAVLGFTQGD